MRIWVVKAITAAPDNSNSVNTIHVHHGDGTCCQKWRWAWPTCMDHQDCCSQIIEGCLCKRNAVPNLKRMSREVSNLAGGPQTLTSRRCRRCRMWVDSVQSRHSRCPPKQSLQRYIQVANFVQPEHWCLSSRRWPLIPSCHNNSSRYCCAYGSHALRGSCNRSKTFSRRYYVLTPCKLAFSLPIFVLLDCWRPSAL